MRLLSTFLLCLLFLGFNSLQAQTAKDATVPITATLNASPVGITLNWVNPGNADLLIWRRTKGQAGGGWIQLVNVAGSNFNVLTDNGVATGQIYEYLIQRTVNGVVAHGYVHVAVNAPAVTNRGKILIFVDSTTADALGPELVRLKKRYAWRWLVAHPFPYRAFVHGKIHQRPDHCFLQRRPPQCKIRAAPRKYSRSLFWRCQLGRHA